MIDRAKVLAYATKYWWAPCEDGIVWVGYAPINVNAAGKKAKDSNKAAEDYVGVFLWYPSKSGANLEALCLVPRSKEKEIEAAKDADRKWSKYASVGIALASYKDDHDDEDENLDVFPTKPPYHGLNDCTHFTSECLIAGGFPIVSEKDAARRGAGDLANYLNASSATKTLCYMAAHDDVQAVVDAGVVRAGDVFAYYKDLKHQYAHHTVPAVSSSTIAMHTWHAFDRPWDLDASDERYSLFHFADDDYTTANAKKWLRWWKVETLGDPKRATPKVDYYHFGDTGTLTVTSHEPKHAKEPPSGASYRWFSTNAKTAVVVRRKSTETKVETFTLPDPKPKDSKDPQAADPKSGDTPTTADGAFSNLPQGSKLSLKGTKLF